MQTRFAPEALADPAMRSSEAIVRKCVHCGFCTATCPTYALLGDELDSPRGRIYLIKDMLENERAPSAEVVKHVDRCLSCLSCMTTCPSGVDYMHLVDHARAYIENRYRRRWHERLVRAALAADTRVERPRGRVALLQGCAEPVLRPEIREATIRLLGRCGYDVAFARGEQCCGALVQHMGREASALDAARANVNAWCALADEAPLDAIIVTASGCGTTIKDYGHMLRDDPAYAEKAARVAGLARDITEFLAETGLPPSDGGGLTVAYHAACSLQHGQKVIDAPKRLLAEAGYVVRQPAEAHLCCGSAGTYNILQPEIAGQLGDRKAANLAKLGADVIATGNIGCAMQLSRHAAAPVVHTIELLDWATGGPIPEALNRPC